MFLLIVYTTLSVYRQGQTIAYFNVLSFSVSLHTCTYSESKYNENHKFGKNLFGFGLTQILSSKYIKSVQKGWNNLNS